MDFRPIRARAGSYLYFKYIYMLLFKFTLGLMFFELVSILFPIVPDIYGNEYMTKENKNWTSFKNFAPKLNLNHNIHKHIFD